MRGHLAEHGLVAATGTARLKRLADAIEGSNTALPEGIRDLAQIEGANVRHTYAGTDSLPKSRP